MVADTKHPVLLQPTNIDVPLWRYMDFPKFVSLISRSSLFFVKVFYLDDRYEGSITRPSKLIEDKWMEGMQKEHDSFDPSKARAQLEQGRRMSRENAYVNCWHMNEHESAAMWKLYSRTNKSVCIQTTYNILRNLLPEFCMLGLVRYIDFERAAIPFDNLLWPLVHKRISFEHEQEVRAFVWALASNCPTDWGANRVQHGIYVHLDLSKLVENIYVNPECPEWFFEIVVETSSKYGIKTVPKNLI